MDLLATPSRRRFLFAALYLSEGAPIGFIWWYLPTRLRAAGVPLEQITGLTAMLVLPWALKFLWAPLVDRVVSARWSRRHWILASQSLMVLTLLPLVAGTGPWSGRLLAGLLLAHAICAATQDVAIDALAIASTAASERGSLNGWLQAGMLTGRSLFGGVALAVGPRVGERAVVVGLIAAVGGSMLLLAGSRGPRPAAEAAAARSWSALLGVAARRRSTWIGLAFALLSGAGFEAVGAVAGPFLIDGGATEAEVGRFLALPAVVAMLIGSLVGGRLSDRFGRLRTVATFLVLLVADVLLLAGLAGAGDAPATRIWLALGLLYFGIGLFVAASYAMFMDLTDPRIGATQFSAFMAATNACESWSAAAVGRLAASAGYSAAFAILGLVSLAALPLLRALRR